MNKGKPQKVVGIGIAKTGTTTLASCLDILGYKNHKSFDRELKKQVESGRFDEALRVAERFDSFEDAPWYHLYKEIDEAFPGSKFILTLRKDPLSQAKSSWHHGVRAGIRKGDPPAEYIDEKISFYESHRTSVLEYFSDRPQDLLTVCWEDGDDWEKLCEFLDAPIPSKPFPVSNIGTYKAKNKFKHFLYNDRRAWLFRKIRYFLASNTVFRKLLGR